MAETVEDGGGQKPAVLQSPYAWGPTEYVSGEPAEATEIRNRVAQLRAKITLNAPSRSAWVQDAMGVLDEILAVVPSLIQWADERGSIGLHYKDMQAALLRIDTLAADLHRWTSHTRALEIRSVVSEVLDTERSAVQRGATPGSSSSGAAGGLPERKPE